MLEQLLVCVRVAGRDDARYIRNIVLKRDRGRRDTIEPMPIIRQFAIKNLYRRNAFLYRVVSLIYGV